MAGQKAAAEVGVGGMLAHAFAEADLERRGNAALRQDLKDQQRLYDPGKERAWQQKYKFFSGQHMKANFRVFARARHDPFNKDPSWGKAVIANVAKTCGKQGKQPSDLLKGKNLTGGGTLNRPEVKKVLVANMPTLSDMEVAAIFDSIDQDHSGVVGLAEFQQALDRGRTSKVPPAAAERWRNPIHRMKRYPPARVEGWDHLLDDIATARSSPFQPEKLCEAEAAKIMDKLGDMLVASPRALQHIDTTTKYDNFSGGGDSARFRRVAWLQDRPCTGGQQRLVGGPRRPSQAQPFEFEDPGPDIRPGFMCEPAARLTPLGKGFAALTPRK